MAEINITTDKDTFSQAKIKEYNKAYKEAYSAEDDAETSLKIEDLKATVDNIEIDEDALTIFMDSKIGYISLTVDLTKEEDMLLKTIEIAVKKLNKFKTVLESLK